MALNLASLPMRTQTRNRLIKSSICRHLREVLSIKRGRDRSTKPQFTRDDSTLSHQRPEEGRFTTAVRANETDHVSALDGRRKIGDECSAFDFDGDSARDRHLVTAAFADIQREIKSASLLRCRSRQSRQAR